ncbi:hypothetical protein TI39_contig4202g00007 [Zymoseptoria brevis]|uniref:Uncharacterized protein n=1 Tax=Zymoseptoria brevis TaxID=1047168 RepID=A0A0F4GBC9_9PEZI|nr:hypothetical protein TI39_contig4202g00007 [Zymoseptoria brevis]
MLDGLFVLENAAEGREGCDSFVGWTIAGGWERSKAAFKATTYDGHTLRPKEGEGQVVQLLSAGFQRAREAQQNPWTNMKFGTTLDLWKSACATHSCFMAKEEGRENGSRKNITADGDTSHGEEVPMPTLRPPDVAGSKSSDRVNSDGSEEEAPWLELASPSQTDSDHIGDDSGHCGGGLESLRNGGDHEESDEEADGEWSNRGQRISAEYMTSVGDEGEETPEVGSETSTNEAEEVNSSQWRMLLP